jgi:putative endonuclease
MRYVYILRSNSCPWRHYVGVTLDPDRRLVAHNAGMSPHTSKYRPWRVMSRQVCKSWKWFSSSPYLAAASGRGISSNLPVTFASDSALK